MSKAMKQRGVTSLSAPAKQIDVFLREPSAPLRVAGLQGEFFVGLPRHQPLMQCHSAQITTED